MSTPDPNSGRGSLEAPRAERASAAGNRSPASERPSGATQAKAGRASPEWTGPFHRRLGELDLTVITDRTYHLDGGALFGVVPKPLWSRQAPSDADNRVRSGLNSLLFRLQGKLVLVETGCGDKLDTRQLRNGGVDPRRDFLDRMRAAGFDPGAVEVVINTHLHYDHCGWNTRRDDRGDVVASFPEARYYAQRAEWEHARQQHERDRVSYLTDNYDPLVSSGQMTLLQGDQELLPGLDLVCLPGHTRGMQAVVVRSAGQTACYISDLMPTHWHLKPSWVMGFDLFPLETIDNKHRVLDQAAREHWLLIFTHDPEFPWGHVELRGGHYEFIPDPPLPAPREK